MIRRKIQNLVFLAIIGTLYATDFQIEDFNTESEFIQDLETALEQDLPKINGLQASEIFNFAKNAIQRNRNLPYDSINLSSHPLVNNEDEDDTNSTGPGTLEWAVGLSSGLAITLCSVCGVVLIPMTKQSWYKHLLLYLIATATASLLGNSLFQLYPPAFLDEKDGETMSDWRNLSRAITCYCAFVLFFVIERLLNIFFGEDDEEEEDEKKAHQGQTNLAADVAGARTRSSTIMSRKLSVGSNNIRARAGSTVAQLAATGAMNAAELTANEANQNQELSMIERMKQVKMVAWMLFIGDALENVADGLAMGAGFGSSIAKGIGITIAIFSEEFPHKIGDFAIFLNAGMDIKMALIVNVISGATVWIGIVIGLLLGSNDDATDLIFAIAAGVFLYVGLGGLFPEMGEVSEELIEEGESPWVTLLLELLGLGTGLAMMILLCVFSDDIEEAFL